MDVLHHEFVAAPGASPGRLLVVLHGIYGNARNWTSVAARLVRERPEWAVALADLRGHGKSPGWTEPPTVGACARDVMRLEEQLGGPADAVLGHSLGGKVALLRARQRDGPPPKQVWVVDAGPGAARLGGGAWRMLQALRNCPGPFASRAAAAEAIARQGFDDAVGRWMATNTRRSGDAWEWRLAAGEMEALLRDGLGTNAWHAIERPRPGLSVHVVKATESRAVSPVAVRRIRAVARRTGRVHLHEVAGGHWLHVDNPDGLHLLLARELHGVAR